MTNRISQDSIQDLLNRVDIISLISVYVNLKKAGTSYVGLCPFHSEKTPSFHVSGDKQLYHCFGCGEGGNAITFIEKKESYSFIDAIKYLANMYGIKINLSNEKENSHISDLTNINKLACEFYYQNLKKNIRAQNYLKTRALGENEIKTFKIGYAQDDWKTLYNYLKTNSKDELLFATGLFIKNEKNNTNYDRFRHRIMFPIFNIHNDVIGFGGRSISNEEPKYLNSAESILYNKSRILYGLNFARDSIREQGFLIIVEGYMDLISLYKGGITNVCASCGTSLTEEHIKLIKRYTNNVLLVFDPDLAGIKAVLRVFKSFIKNGLSCKVLELPNKLDPDNFINKYGGDALKTLIKEKTIDILEFYIKKNIEDENDYIKKISIIKEFKELLGELEDSIERELVIKQIARHLKISPEILTEELTKLQSTSTINKETTKSRNYFMLPEEERLLLKIALHEASFREKLINEKIQDYFITDLTKKILDYLAQSKCDEINFNISLIEDENVKNIISKLLWDECEYTSENINAVFNDALSKIKKRNLKSLKEKLMTEIKLAENSNNSIRLAELLKEKINLDKVSL